MMNEFERVTLQCDGAYITPRNVGNLTKYPLVLGANQVCTLRGSTPGIAAVPGRDYILANFEYNYLGAYLAPDRYALTAVRQMAKLRHLSRILRWLQSSAGVGGRVSRHGRECTGT